MKYLIAFLVFCLVFLNSLQASCEKYFGNNFNFIVKPHNRTTWVIDSTSKLYLGNLCVLNKAQKLFIQHTVLPNEDLKAIAKKYYSNAKEIIKINFLKNNEIKKGDSILIPTNKILLLKITGLNYDEVYKYKTDLIAKYDEKKDSTFSSNLVKKDSSLKEFHANANSIDFKEVFTHTVQNAETIEMIAKRYKITVLDIINWNDLGTNRIKIGQELIINSAKARKPYVALNLPNRQSQNVNLKIADSLVSVEKGICLLVNEETNEVSHKNLPAGSLILVTNLVNKNSMFLRTTQNFSDTNKEVVLKIDKAIAQKIGIEKNSSLIELKFTIQTY